MILDKAEPSKLPLWVKILNVPMEAWSVKGISALASSLGKPIIMDDMTAKMCVKGEGRLSFARVLIEVDAGKELKKEIEVVYKGSKSHEKFTKKIQVEYVWKPPCCDVCKVFGHDNKGCRLNEKEENGNNKEKGIKDNGNQFTEVQKRRTFAAKENQNFRKWNGNNRLNVNRGCFGINNRGKENVSQEKKVYNSKGKSNENMNKGETSYNRFTLLDSLVGEEDLIPSVDKRKIVDEKELIEAAKDLKQDEDVDSEILIEDEFGIVIEEHSNGSSVPNSEMNEFAHCIRDVEVEDILSLGVHFTWTKSRNNPKCKTLKKLDRIMISKAFMDKFHNSSGMFLPYMISDHSLVVLKIPNGMEKRRQAFRFSNFVTDKKEFIPMVKEAWEVDIEGHMMYRIVKKMKLMKKSLNKLSWANGNIFVRVKNLRDCLKEVQIEVDKYPYDENLKSKSCKILSEYYEAMKDESNLLMQKAKIEWLKDGDRNTEFFHKIIKGRTHKGIEFLGKKDVVDDFPTKRIVFPNKLSREEEIMMCRGISEVEVKNAMFEIEDSKAPGPGGFTARFYKSTWSIVGKDICKAIQEFFITGKLLGEFSININEERQCYFCGGRGLRQGDPMSPYLFTLVMEVFNIIMKKNISEAKKFKYHQGCNKLGITHMCFTDDLLVFCHGDTNSVKVMKETLEEFSRYSGVMKDRDEVYHHAPIVVVAYDWSRVSVSHYDPILTGVPTTRTCADPIIEYRSPVYNVPE
ncbi:RNA-directed DNA polymerase, eukaryota, reverse transcriptase zinc-binding domain protein [Tanacetum coccineum]